MNCGEGEDLAGTHLRLPEVEVLQKYPPGFLHLFTKPCHEQSLLRRCTSTTHGNVCMYFHSFLIYVIYEFADLGSEEKLVVSCVLDKLKTLVEGRVSRLHDRREHCHSGIKDGHAFFKESQAI